MSNAVKITIAAHCDKAARQHNEDNCLVLSDVASGIVNHTGDGSYLSPQIDLGEKGCLLVVADGMGGMNAGEVASQMAVDAVRKFFSNDKLDEVSLEDDVQVSRLVYDAIDYADACIKSAAVSDSEKSGMGTTIVVLWILGRKAYIGWCGDSRIYRFNKQTKILTQLSKDHSYVQMLVDQHQITEDEAFEHPDSNVLLRSLGDAFEGVSPELLRPLNLTEDDVFMMCSDGLCGVLRNSEIRTIMTRASVEHPIKHLDEWHKLLWDHARKAGWHDNVTTVLCHIGNCAPIDNEPPVQKKEGKKESRYNRKDPMRYTIIAVIAVLFALGAVFALIKMLDKPSKKTEKTPTEQTTDSGNASNQQKPKSLPPVNGGNGGKGASEQPNNAQSNQASSSSASPKPAATSEPRSASTPPAQNAQPPASPPPTNTPPPTKQPEKTVGDDREGVTYF